MNWTTTTTTTILTKDDGVLCLRFINIVAWVCAVLEISYWILKFATNEKLVVAIAPCRLRRRHRQCGCCYYYYYYCGCWFVFLAVVAVVVVNNIPSATRRFAWKVRVYSLCVILYIIFCFISVSFVRFTNILLAGYSFCSNGNIFCDNK